MKGRYDGCIMNVYSTIPRYRSLASTPKLSKRAKQRLKVDGGSEFQHVFEEECRRKGVKLFVLPPCLARLNGDVERAERTHTEESYQVTDTSFEIAELNQALLKRETVY